MWRGSNWLLIMPFSIFFSRLQLFKGCNCSKRGSNKKKGKRVNWQWKSLNTKKEKLRELMVNCLYLKHILKATFFQKFWDGDTEQRPPPNFTIVMGISRRYKLFQLVVLLIGVLLLFINLNPSVEPVMPDPPDLLPFRINVREIQGEIVWPISKVTVGLPISQIQDLGEKKPRVLLVIIVSTAPLRWERRNAIRQTWWKYCSVKEVSSVSHGSGQINYAGITFDLLL